LLTSGSAKNLQIRKADLNTLLASFSVGWGSTQFAYPARGTEVGPHLSRKPSGSSLTSGSAKNLQICKADLNTLHRGRYFSVFSTLKFFRIL
jgi:hypothetical protein